MQPVNLAAIPAAAAKTQGVGASLFGDADAQVPGMTGLEGLFGGDVANPFAQALAAVMGVQSPLTPVTTTAVAPDAEAAPAAAPVTAAAFLVTNQDAGAVLDPQAPAADLAAPEAAVPTAEDAVAETTPKTATLAAPAPAAAAAAVRGPVQEPAARPAGRFDNFKPLAGADAHVQKAAQQTPSADEASVETAPVDGKPVLETIAPKPVLTAKLPAPAAATLPPSPAPVTPAAAAPQAVAAAVEAPPVPVEAQAAAPVVAQAAQAAAQPVAERTPNRAEPQNIRTGAKIEAKSKALAASPDAAPTAVRARPAKAATLDATEQQAAAAPAFADAAQTAAAETDDRAAPQALTPATTDIQQAAAQPRVDGRHLAAHTVAHLAGQIVEKSQGKATRFDVQLDPAGLGKVDVRIEIGARGELSASMSFDNPQAAAEMRGRQAELRNALEQAGFDLSKGGLSFDLSGQSAGQGMFEQQAEQQRPVWRGHAFTDLSMTTDAPIHPRSRSTAPGGVDVTI